MIIFENKTARRTINNISLNINNLKFFDMCKITTKNPILQRNGVEYSFMYSISVTYDYWLDGYASPRGNSFLISSLRFNIDSSFLYH